MKPRLAFLAAAVTLGAVWLGGSRLGRVEVHVVDEASVPVAGARVQVGFFMPRTSLGANIQATSGQTGKSGIFLTRRLGVNIAGVLVDKEGYYPSGTGFGGTTSVHHFVLKRIVRPIPLCVRTAEFKMESGTGVPVGFDLEVGDLVAPLGSGKRSDITFVREGSFEADSKEFDVTFKVQFSEPEDGILETMMDSKSGSSLRLPREAPEGVYSSHLIRRRRTGDPGFDENRAYFLRVRSSRLETGSAVSGNFAKIVGDFVFSANGKIRFQYYFNPERGNRNLEFDVQRNLLSQIPGREFLNLP